jgi:hypothetical protein
MVVNAVVMVHICILQSHQKVLTRPPHVDTFFISPWPSEIQGNIFSLWLVYVVGFARYIYIYIYIEILSFVDIENVYRQSHQQSLKD